MANVNDDDQLILFSDSDDEIFRLTTKNSKLIIEKDSSPANEQTLS